MKVNLIFSLRLKHINFILKKSKHIYKFVFKTFLYDLKVFLIIFLKQFLLSKSTMNLEKVYNFVRFYLSVYLIKISLKLPLKWFLIS